MKLQAALVNLSSAVSVADATAVEAEMQVQTGFMQLPVF